MLLSLVSGRLQLRGCQLTLLTSLAFGAVLAVFSAPLTAQTTQNSPGIPNLKGYDSDTRGMMELACLSEMRHGPVAYRECLDQQIAALQNSPGIPNLKGYDSETRGMMELACLSEMRHGPAAYRECLNEQVASLTRYESEVRRKTSPASKSGGTSRNSPAAQVPPTTTLSQSEFDALIARLKQLWNIPAGIEYPEEMVVVIQVRLTRDRRLAAPPVIVSRGSSPTYQVAAEAARRAVLEGQPFNMLRDESYDAWKDMEIKFDPKAMFRTSQ